MEFVSFDEITGKYLSLLEEHAAAESDISTLEESLRQQKAELGTTIDVIGNGPFLEQVDQLARRIHELNAAKESLKSIEAQLLERLKLVAPLELSHNIRRRGKRLTYLFSVENDKLKVSMNIPAVTSQVINY